MKEKGILTIFHQNHFKTLSDSKCRREKPKMNIKAADVNVSVEDLRLMYVANMIRFRPYAEFKEQMVLFALIFSPAVQFTTDSHSTF